MVQSAEIDQFIIEYKYLIKFKEQIFWEKGSKNRQLNINDLRKYVNKYHSLNEDTSANIITIEDNGFNEIDKPHNIVLPWMSQGH